MRKKSRKRSRTEFDNGNMNSLDLPVLERLSCNTSDAECDQSEERETIDNETINNVRSYHEKQFNRLTIDMGGISSVTEDSDYHNHNHNHVEQDMNLSMDSDIEHASMAQSRKRRRCSDWRQYMLR